MPKIKLTDADVRGLRYARNMEGASLAFLANAYGVSKAQVSRVTRGLQRRTPEVSSHEETPEVGKWVRDEWEGSDVVSYTIQDKTSEVGKWSDELQTHIYKFKTVTPDLTEYKKPYKYITIDLPTKIES